jgi:YD repeat-containing protein
VSGGDATASFVYDGDGARVKGTAGGVTTAYVSNYFEWTGSTATMKKYYYSGGTRIAVRGGTTHTTSDVWGRTTWAIPPTGASVHYSSYDTQGRRLQVIYGSAETNLTYDKAGRNLSMDDPDLGDWDYGYDALGNLAYQDDANHQRICMYYDSLSRLTGKYYTTDTTPCPPSRGMCWWRP